MTVNNLNKIILKKIIKEIQNKPENEKVRIMWSLVIFCMIIVLGIWKINFDLNKPAEINFNNSGDLNIPSFPELESLDKGIDDIKKINEEELDK
jgi:hypothetical protein